MAQKDFCIIGLGAFGIAVAETLIALKQNVTVVDIDEQKINNFKNKIGKVTAYRLDATNIEALSNLEPQRFSKVIIAIGSSMLSSILIAAGLKEIQVNNIIAKAYDTIHERVLRAIEISQIIKPDVSTGRQTALKAFYNLEIDIKDVDAEFSISQIIVKNKEILNKPLSELAFFQSTKLVNIIRIKRDKKIFLPNPEEVLHMDDEILFIAKTSELKGFYDYITDNQSE